mmetsp:Transcript_3562/g.8983  ORF Transcript_3562/g.8983 Transcript_3562/m.8983 type:complete len:414 (-) Transcript_3562:110-1351(-)
MRPQGRACLLALAACLLAGKCEPFLVTSPGAGLLGGRGSPSLALRGSPSTRASARVGRAAAPSRTGGVPSLACSAGVEDEPLFKEIPRPEAGAILVANESEVDHFFRQAAVLVLECGPSGSKGLILEMATAFQLGEMSPSSAGTVFKGNSLFRGGGGSSDATTMLHACSEVEGSTPIGHGLYTGGVQSAIKLVEEGKLSQDQFKFFYNYCEWGPGALEGEVMQGTWRVGIVPPELCLRQVSSQSERPMMNVQKRMTNDEPLWNIVRKEVKDTLPPVDDSDPEEVFVPLKPVVLDPMKKMIIGMATERVYFWRNNKDATSLVPLLDTGATVFGERGNDNIKAALEKQWEGVDVEYVVDPEKDITVSDNGVTFVNFTKKTLKEGGKRSTNSKVTEEIVWSENAMIRSMREVKIGE